MKGLAASFRYALAGLLQVFKTERNMKIHLTAGIAALLLSAFFHLSWTEFLFVLTAMAMVFMAEAFNTAIETVVDLVSPERHQLAGKAKDIAAGAVLVTAVFAVLVGIIVFGRHIWPRVF